MRVISVAITGCSASPVTEVITTIESLITSIKEEGTAEAETYDTFACFCKDTSAAKSTSIDDGVVAVNTLVGDLDELTADKRRAEAKIQAETKNIEELSMKFKAENDRWTTVLAHYTRDHTDMVVAVDEVTKATEAFASNPAMFLQSEAFHALLRRNPADLSKGDFEGHNAGITAVLDKLKDQFESQTSNMESEHESQTAAHSSLVENIAKEISSSQDDLTDAKAEVEDIIEDIADKKDELTEKQADLFDDQEYLKELSKTCEAKAKLWDQRTTARKEEIEALEEAMAIVNGDAKAGEGQLTLAQRSVRTNPSFIQLSSRTIDPVDSIDEEDVSDGSSAVSDDDGEDKAEAVPDAKDSTVEAPDTPQDEADEDDVSQQETQEEEDQVPSFVQMATRARNLRVGGKPSTNSEEIATLLEAQAARLNSTQLSALATMARAPDPFKKVKILIQHLIEDLLEEARKDAEQKGWCDKEMSTENKTATHNHNKVKEDTAAIFAAEATKALKESDIEDVQEEIDDLKKDLKDAAKLRNEEKEENMASLEESQKAANAVQRAITLLKDHYKKAETKARVFNGGNAVNSNRFTGKLMQLNSTKGVVDDAPDAGFSKGTSGDQSGGKGVIGSLEDLKGEFDSAAKNTADNEKSAAEAFVDLSKSTKESISNKEASMRHAEKDLKNAKRELTQQLSNLKKHQLLCDNALAALDKLVLKCVDAGMDFEERKTRRQEEIDALHHAIELFDQR